MYKFLIFIILLCLNNLQLFSQKITVADKKELIKKEDSLKKKSIQILQGINTEDRFYADSLFTKTFVRALKIKNSFYYPFDSLQTISKLYPDDSSFRIFTWQIEINENSIRQHGAIQMKTKDGSLKLFPLIDKSDIVKNLEDTIANSNGWIGAVYYKLIMKNDGSKNYYTLLGYDENNFRSSKKIIEVLTFENSEPIFGGNYFSFEKDSIRIPTKNRVIVEYKKDAGPRLNYDPELDLILYEHLISETNEPDKKWTLVGDGDYEGFRWQNGKWVHIEKVFDYVTPLNNEPVPQPTEKENLPDN